jgi:hypothetical protein
MKISLERKETDKSKESPMEACCERPKYPTLYISEVEGIDELEMGQEIMLKARVSMTKETETKDSEKCEVELEVLELSSTGKMAMKPSEDKESEDAVDKGLDEAISKKSKKEDEDASETE